MPQAKPRFMQKEILHTQLKEMLETIREQTENLRNEPHPGMIEFDILLRNIRDFYERIHLLQRYEMQRTPITPSPPQTRQPIRDPKPAEIPHPSPVWQRPQPPIETPTSPKAEDQITPPAEDQITPPAEDQNTPPAEASPHPEGEDQPAIPLQPEKEEPPLEIKSMERPLSALKKEEQQKKKEQENPNLDLFASEEPTFNIKLKEAREQSLPKKPGSTHLKEMIGINDKFIFINELFDGDLKSYNEAIDAFSRFGTKHKALERLDELRRQNLWNAGSVAFEKFRTLVEGFYP